MSKFTGLAHVVALVVVKTIALSILGITHTLTNTGVCVTVCSRDEKRLSTDGGCSHSSIDWLDLPKSRKILVPILNAQSHKSHSRRSAPYCLWY